MLPRGGFHFQADTKGGCHGLVDEVYVAATGVLGGVTDGADFNFRGTGRNTHHQFEVGGENAAMTGVYLFDEAANHHFCGVEVCDNTIPQRTDGLDAGIGFFMHHLGLLAQCDALPRLVVDSYDRGLVQHNLIILENDGVGGTQVHSQFLV